MNADDMLDVIHYFLEEDLQYTTSEEAEVRNSTRSRIYESMYDRTYAYAKPEFESPTADSHKYIEEEQFLQGPEDEIVKPFDPKKAPPIPYSPPTKFDPEAENPFGSVLDTPLQ